MKRRTPRYTNTDTLCTYTKVVRARGARAEGGGVHAHHRGAGRADPVLYSRGGGAHARTRNRQAGAQGAAQDPRRQGGERDDHARQPRRVRGRAQISLRAFRGGEPDRRGHRPRLDRGRRRVADDRERDGARQGPRSEEHTSELQSLMRISYAVFFLKTTKYYQIQE